MHSYRNLAKIVRGAQTTLEAENGDAWPCIAARQIDDQMTKHGTRLCRQQGDHWKRWEMGQRSEFQMIQSSRGRALCGGG